MLSPASGFMPSRGLRTPRRRWSWAPGAVVTQRPRGVDYTPERGRLEFYVLWSPNEPPRQLSSKCHRKCYQTRLPLPLPSHLVIFGLGDWNHFSQKTSISVEILVSPDIKPQRIGNLGPETRCLVWEGDWRVDVLMASFKQAQSGHPFKLLLTVNEPLFNSTPTRPFQAPEPSQSPVLPEDAVQGLDGPSEAKSQNSTMIFKKISAEKKFSPVSENMLLLSAPKISPQQGEFEIRKKMCHPNPIQLNKTRRALFEFPASEQQQESEDLDIKELQVCPSPRWCHAMCLSDPETAVLIGGEGANQQCCKDALWKLEIDSDFWFPMDFPEQDSIPQCSWGHSATYDPDTKRIYIFGGMREGKRYGAIYILDTTSWKWLHVSAKGKVPTLAYHSATIYRQELFVFGGAFPKMSSLEPGACSNALFIFNPEYEIWYQPIIEGEKPLPRLGHSATLLRNKMIIFGGQRASTYLNDMHFLDLGFMEYTSVPFLPGQPSARSFHAAIPVSDQKVLISGGCNAKGAFRDAYTFHLDTLTWNTVKHADLCSVPRAGHTLLNLTCAHLTDTDKESRGKHNLCMVLVFGGSDRAGSFYNSTVKLQLDLKEVKGGSEDPA
ncbi:hypothetical protein JRQ81_000985 [Phrynocephalus forsythii]|uniref:Uncharacterized protein n=1 Tax=Phrynocephalus forsythii TaxID=171643 RepID=A0A9Q0Y688_9SAUR|nr:hypothetical protein JRQ81_000985 [Phrynocephalus forsythii]